jgi:hypothetical protein
MTAIQISRIILLAYSGALRAQHGCILIRSPFREQGPDLPSQLPRETGTAYAGGEALVSEELPLDCPRSHWVRKAYGFRTFRIAEIALYHALGNLPEPKLAHRFY